MDTINKLTELFSKFPGIGPRQSKRFVYFLLTRNGAYLEELSKQILELKKDVSTCQSCYRFFTSHTPVELCTICRDQTRSHYMLMVVERDADFENIEKSNIYEGKYFILGGKVPLLEKNPEQKIRAHELVTLVNKYVKNNELKEIILALSVNPDGEHTEKYVRQLITPLTENRGIKISLLGRGLSTGIELEYPDRETLKNAFQNRK